MASFLSFRHRLFLSPGPSAQMPKTSKILTGAGMFHAGARPGGRLWQPQRRQCHGVSDTAGGVQKRVKRARLSTW